MLTVARADASAVPFVMATERTAGFEQLVGRWDEARHRAALADGRHVYFIGRDGTEPVGFVIVRDWASPERVTIIKRMVVARPGLGYGRALLGQVVDAVFRETDAWRVWLSVYPDNTPHRTSARGLTDFDTARNHHPFDARMFLVDVAGRHFWRD
jgi:RimJ/RimL family protein N-acetyltransferase